MELLRKINFKSDDVLYILGDAIDRGKDSIKCIKHIIDAPNIHMLMGNHEQMMLDALTDNLHEDSSYMSNWLENGGTEVLPAFIKLPKVEQMEIMKFIAHLPYMAEVIIKGQNYVLVHAGLNVVDASSLGRATTAEILPKQQLDDLTWIREKFYKNRALPKSITIFGHTPTMMIAKQARAKVWRDKKWGDKIGIDGGCVYGGSLLALRLDDMAEFAV
jgi:serine/threonine protein phosphatase 1